MYLTVHQSKVVPHEVEFSTGADVIVIAEHFEAVVHLKADSATTVADGQVKPTRLVVASLPLTGEVTTVGVVL